MTIRFQKANPLTIALVVLTAALSSGPEAGELAVAVDCSSASVSVSRDVDLVSGEGQLWVILAKYPEWDPGCDEGKRTEIRHHRLAAFPRTAQLSFSQLGVEVPPDCTSYVVSAVAVSLSTEETAAASCSPEESLAPLSTGNCLTPPLRTQIEADLLFYNRIDVNRISSLHCCGGPASGGCISADEYVANVRNRSSTGTPYDVSVNAQYICSRCAGEVPCDSEPPILGPGWNVGTVSSDESLPAGECLGLKLVAPGGQTALPSCCDRSRFAGQCAQFTVTKVGDTACSPAYFTFSRSKDGGIALGGVDPCKIEPSHSSVRLNTSCPNDADLDGEIDGCTCGNGVVEAEAGELCDGSNLIGFTCSDLDLGCTGGTLLCNLDCKGFDTRNCTGCIECPESQTCCVEGCYQSCCSCCAKGLTHCPGECVDLMVDPDNCGACGVACPPGQTCESGSCV